MSIDEIIQEVLDEQTKLEEREEFFERIYPKSHHNFEYDTKKYHRAKDYAKLLFRKFLKRIENKYFIIIEKFYNNNKRFTIGRLIGGKFAYYDERSSAWKNSTLNFGFPPEHSYISWYKTEGPDAKTHRFKIHRGWSIDLQDLFDKTNEYDQLFTFDDEESMLLYYEMMKGE